MTEHEQSVVDRFRGRFGGKLILTESAYDEGIRFVDLESFILQINREAEQRGRDEENARLEQVAREYQKKGFELETFIYSGFLRRLVDTARTKEVKE